MLLSLALTQSRKSKMVAHIPVLKSEVLNWSNVSKGDVVIDATFGAGGHASALCKKIGPSGFLLGIDTDHSVTTRQDLNFAACTFRVVTANFRSIREVAKREGLPSPHFILFDLGISSTQLDNPDRGFSFKEEGPLDMRFDQTLPLTAEEIVNTWQEETLRQIFEGFSDSPAASRVARAICQERRRRVLKSTKDLSDVIIHALPMKMRTRRRHHPATVFFQALRMAVNDEYNALKEGLRGAWALLRRKGRLAVISFHSIEDREVKRFFIALEKEGKGMRPFKRPVTPSEDEITKNPRARSAKLRVIEKIENSHE